jgi:hypothetical protein
MSFYKIFKAFLIASLKPLKRLNKGERDINSYYINLLIINIILFNKKER